MKEISDILATFHDGRITGFKGDHSELELQIGCAYLAEIEKKGNEFFFFTITDVQRFELHYWDGIIVTTLEPIIDLDLEIGYSKVEDGIVKTSCNIWTEKEGDSSGELWIEAQYGHLKNQDKQLLQPEILYELSSSYWNRFNE